MFVARHSLFMNGIPKAGFFDVTLILFDYRKRYRVEGDSMTPTLQPGEQVAVDEKTDIKIGDVVVALHPFKKSVVMIKRVKEIDSNGRYFLISDNLEGSTDSRSFGAVSVECIKGKVISRLK